MILSAVCLSAGCGFGDLEGMASSPGSGKGVFAAEYDLAASRGGVLVLVNQPVWLDPGENLRFHLTEALVDALVNKVKVSRKRLIAYKRLAAFRSGRSDFSLLSPSEIGKALGADIVLVAELAGGGLEKLPESGYYSASLSASALLVETASGKQIWPDDFAGKPVKVGFEIEPKGRDVAVMRLSQAFAHCTTRYLYDCRKKHFKIFDDRIATDWRGDS
jgi:hypothetical protein